MPTYQTHNGKEIQIVPAHNSPHVAIQFASGGALPDEFQGVFTNVREAQIAIGKYLDRTKGRAK